jgi:hypothetical protein
MLSLSKVHLQHKNSIIPIINPLAHLECWSLHQDRFGKEKQNQNNRTPFVLQKISEFQSNRNNKPSGWKDEFCGKF